MPSPSLPSIDRAGTGVDGLDDVLCGGLPREHLYLIQGHPGAGKTTLAMQFLLNGRDKGESVLYVTLSETAGDLRATAVSHGWSLDGIEIYEHSPAAAISSEAFHTLFHPDEVDLSETIDELLAVIERMKPTRIVLDSLSELRLLAGDNLRYRRQIMALRDRFVQHRCTVLMLDDRSAGDDDMQLLSVAHGVIQLNDIAPEYGADRRRLRVTKLRGVRFRGGYHDYAINTGGIAVFPRLVAAEHRTDFQQGRILSGVGGLDELFDGGLDRGTTTLLIGPSGTGKSTVATRYAVTSADRGEHVAIYAFDERLPTLFARSKALGMDLDNHVRSGAIVAKPIDPAELTPGEFSSLVREAVEQHGTKMVLIDSLSGYLNAMPESRHLILQLHELLTYLGQKGVTTIITAVQHGMLGTMPSSDLDVSYLADNVLLFRHYEFEGEIRQALSVFKRRAGAHERTIRRLTLGGAAGIVVGEPLRQYRGVMTGVPLYGESDGPVSACSGSERSS